MTADRSDELAQELERLHEGNVRLLGLLDAHGIAWRVPKPATTPAAAAAATPPTTDDKVALFRRLFRGRTDVYPVRWQSKTGRAGYSRAGVCEKPRIKCSDCRHRLLLPLTDQTSQFLISCSSPG